MDFIYDHLDSPIDGWDDFEGFNGYTFYAHNGGRFDVLLLVEGALLNGKKFMIDGKKCIEQNGSWIGFCLKDRKDKTKKILFKDSYRLVPGSLEDLLADFKVPHQKLTETVNHNKINAENYMALRPSISKYLEHDTKGLLEMVEIFAGKAHSQSGIDVTKCYTGASYSKKDFMKNYYDPRRYPIYTMPTEVDKDIRESYYGGRVECFKLGKVRRKLYYMDFTSMFPDQGRKMLPYGVPLECEFQEVDTPEAADLTFPEYQFKKDKKGKKHEVVDREEYKRAIEYHSKLPDGFFGFVHCRVRHRPEALEAIIERRLVPKHALKENGKLYFPALDEWTDMWLFTPELDYKHYEYQFVRGYHFKRHRLLRSFFNDGFNDKAKAKKNGDKAIAQVHKIKINSGYGFWGLRTKDRDGVVIMNAGDHRFHEYLASEKLVDYRETDEYVLARVVQDLPIKDFNVSIAAAITSYSRERLYHLIMGIIGKGGEMVYCDTDSVISTLNLKEHPDLMREFMWDGTGDELGSLKNEMDDELIKALGKDECVQSIPKKERKARVKEMVRDLSEKEYGGCIPFDYAVVTGLKQYSLSADVPVCGKSIHVEINKLKGFKKVKKEDLEEGEILLTRDVMERLAEGGKIWQNQVQFSAPRSRMVSEVNAFKVKKNVIEKSFRMYYSKGKKLENGDVQPFTISEIRGASHE